MRSPWRKCVYSPRLTQHRAEIIAAERRFKVDRRAIAGAIAWEALINVRGRFTQIFGRGVGPGKALVWDYHIDIYPPTPLDISGGVAVTLTFRHIGEAGGRCRLATR